MAGNKTLDLAMGFSQEYKIVLKEFAIIINIDSRVDTSHDNLDTYICDE